MATIDMAGKRIGKWTVIEQAKHGQYGTYWVCRCDCGNERIVRGWSLRHGGSLSCGCENGSYKHGDCAGGKLKRLRVIWSDMKSRCNNPKNTGFHLYGGRGIRVCEEWQNDYASFRTWALANGYRDDLSIDRIDTNGNYEPSNCRWATTTEQQKNRRNTVFATAQGRTNTLDEWAEILGTTKSALYHKKHRGTLQKYLESATVMAGAEEIADGHDQ